MAAVTWKMYRTARLRIFQGAYNLETDTFKIALFLSTSNALSSLSTSSNLADLTNQHANANGYTTGGVTVNGAVTQSTDTVTFDTDDAAWTASGGSITARFAVCYDDTHASDGLLAVSTLDSTPADVTVTDGNTLTVGVTGLFTSTGMT